MEHDEIIHLPSGTEISVEAALGDISRTISRMADALVTDWSAEMADLEHVAELIRVLANREETPCQ